MINLTALSHALAILDEGSFAGAAMSLGLSQPTLSRQIRALELALGLRLFDRGRHGAIPTPLGQQVLTRAAALVRSATLLDREIELLRGVDLGDLRVGAGVYPAFLSLGTALGRLASSHPRLHVSTSVGDWRTLADKVLEAKLDLAIVELTAADGDPHLKLEALPEHQGTFICRPGHPLLALSAPSLTDIFQYPFAGTRLAPRVIELLGDAPTAGHIDEVTGEYVPSIEVNTIRMATEAVAGSDAFGIVPLVALDDLLLGGRLQALPVQPPWLKTRYGFVTLRNRTLSPATMAFMQAVRTVESELMAEEIRALEPPDRVGRHRRQSVRQTPPRERGGRS